MNPQNQKPENTNPDLDFIRNITDPLEAPVKKGLDKKIIVIIVLVVITIVVMVFGMMTGANNKVQKSSKTTNTSISSDANVSKAKDTLIQYFELMAQGNLEEAYKFFSGDAPMTKELFVKENSTLPTQLNFSSCEPVSSNSGLVDKEGKLIQTFRCDSKDGKQSIDFEFHMDSSDNGSLTIHEYFIYWPNLGIE